MKQIEMVLDAVHAGWDNAEVIANEVGLSKRAVSAYLCELRRMGLVEAIATLPPEGRSHGRLLYRMTVV